MPIGAAVDPAAGTAVGATAQAATGAAIAGPPGSDPVLIRLLAINDFHGQLGDSDAVVDGVPIGGAATLAAYMNRERAADPAGTVMVSAGDAFGASPPESSLLDHESTMAVLTQMGLDVATFGNHEWDRGFNETMRLVFGGKRTMTVNGKQVATGPMWPGSPFPWVSANLVDRKTGKPLVPPFYIKTVNGVKVAFIGATTQHLKEVTLASGIPNVGVLDPATAINKYVALLKAQGIKQFVVLIHEGGETDPATGQVTGDIVDVVNHLDPSISAVVSAHSHQKYVTRINGILVTQAQSYAKAFAEIDMTVDRNTGETIKTDGKIITNDERGIAPDPTVAQMVSKFQHIVAPKTQRVVSILPGAITRKASPAGETAMGTLLAEAQRTYAKADIALMNPGGIRQDLTTGGPVTWGKLFGVQPFANRLMLMDMTGKQLAATLEQMFPPGVGTHPTMLQVAGMRVWFDMSKPLGQRVTKVVTDDGKLLNPKKHYRVVANNFLANGGDGFTELATIKKKTEVGIDLDAFASYLAAGKPVPLNPIGRLNITGGSLPADAH
ncbi:MAG TPA: bifunctional metallophosphatase/5'-nucleotidase [Burkholderiaceae bacterium]